MTKQDHPSRTMVAGWVVLCWLAVASTRTAAAVGFEVGEPRGLRSSSGSAGDGAGDDSTDRRSLQMLVDGLDGLGSMTQQTQCRSISEILCETAVFDSFCGLLQDAGAYDDLAGDGDSSWTVFAPTNTALENVLAAGAIADETDGGDGDDLASSTWTMEPSVVNSTEWEDLFQTDLLEFHIIENRVVRGAFLRLACDATLVMRNGASTTILCDENDDEEDGVYLAGDGNTRDTLSSNGPPRLVVTDVVACNGVIHVIDKVLVDGPDDDTDTETSFRLPVSTEINQDATTGSCRSMQEVVCEREDLSSMCAFLNDATLGVLTGTEEEEEEVVVVGTLFAPTDAAFDAIRSAIDAMGRDKLLSVLRFHALSDVATSSDLICDGVLEMGNGQSSTTSCSAFSGDTYQIGPGNFPPRNPRIVDVDAVSCAGVVHVVDNVMLPFLGK